MASKIAPRAVSVPGFEPNFGTNIARSFGNGCVESRTIDDGEIETKHIAFTSNLYSIPVVLQYELVAAANGAGLTIVAALPHGMRIISVIAISTATVGSATVKITNGTADITSTIAADTAKAVTVCTTVDQTYATLATGATLKVIANGANDRASITIIGVKTAG